MKRNPVFTVCILTLVLTAVALVGTVAHSRDTVGELVEKLRTLAGSLRAQREMHDRERRLAHNRKTLLLEEIEALKRREKELTARSDTFEQEARSRNENLQKLTAEAGAEERQRSGIQKLVRAKASALANRIDAGLPLDIEARGEMAGKLTARSEADADGLKLLWQLYVQEYRRAGEIETSSNTIEVAGGAKLEGIILRIGAVGAVFLSNDGGTAAALVKSPKGYIWARLGGYGELSQVRSCFETAAGRRAPEIINVPLDFGAAGGGK